MSKKLDLKLTKMYKETWCEHLSNVQNAVDFIVDKNDNPFAIQQDNSKIPLKIAKDKKALCQKYYSSKWCAGCPIRKYTNEKRCERTPYTLFEYYLLSPKFCINTSNPAKIKKDLHRLIQNEINFIDKVIDFIENDCSDDYKKEVTKITNIRLINNGIRTWRRDKRDFTNATGFSIHDIIEDHNQIVGKQILLKVNEKSILFSPQTARGSICKEYAPIGFYACIYCPVDKLTGYSDCINSPYVHIVGFYNKVTDKPENYTMGMLKEKFIPMIDSEIRFLKLLMKFVKGQYRADEPWDGKMFTDV